MAGIVQRQSCREQGCGNTEVRQGSSLKHDPRSSALFALSALVLFLPCALLIMASAHFKHPLLLIHLLPMTNSTAHTHVISPMT
jgi:hypothetical protein